LAVCQTNSGCGIINDKGKIIFSDRYNDAFIAADNVVGLLYQGRWTVAKAGKEPAWKDVYDWIGKYYSGGYAIAQKNGRYCFINKDGEVEGQTYAMIVDDESAVPNGASQVFTRIAENSVKAFSKEGEPELPAMKDTVSSKTIAVKTRTSTVPHVVRNNSNWRSISRQSPFYSEAAKVLSGKLEETDAESRRVILNYVEHLRTSYTTKDIDFLNQLFSENALIVVGNVIRTSSERNTTYLSPSQVTYNVHSKQEYLSKLRMVFNSNKTIQVRFSDFHILRHPTVVGIYGVSLRQHYKSDRYSDDGYLFLLWDFRDASAPKIYVRTWQPYMMDNHSPLPEESVFNIRNFNLQ
jgi:hypothetical protein